MKRWHEEKAIMAKNVKERKRSTYDHSGQYLFDDKRAKLGYYRKQDAYDCGKPGCQICHCEKVHHYARRQELKANLKFREELEE